MLCYNRLSDYNFLLYTFYSIIYLLLCSVYMSSLSNNNFFVERKNVVTPSLQLSKEDSPLCHGSGSPVNLAPFSSVFSWELLLLMHLQKRGELDAEGEPLHEQDISQLPPLGPEALAFLKALTAARCEVVSHIAGAKSFFLPSIDSLFDMLFNLTEKGSTGGVRLVEQIYLVGSFLRSVMGRKYCCDILLANKETDAELKFYLDHVLSDGHIEEFSFDIDWRTKVVKGVLPQETAQKVRIVSKKLIKFLVTCHGDHFQGGFQQSLKELRKKFYIDHYLSPTATISINSLQLRFLEERKEKRVEKKLAPCQVWTGDFAVTGELPLENISSADTLQMAYMGGEYRPVAADKKPLRAIYDNVLKRIRIDNPKSLNKDAWIKSYVSKLCSGWFTLQPELDGLCATELDSHSAEVIANALRKKWEKSCKATGHKALALLFMTCAILHRQDKPLKAEQLWRVGHTLLPLDPSLPYTAALLPLMKLPSLPFSAVMAVAELLAFQQVAFPGSSELPGGEEGKISRHGSGYAIQHKIGGTVLSFPFDPQAAAAMLHESVHGKLTFLDVEALCRFYCAMTPSKGFFSRQAISFQFLPSVFQVDLLRCQAMLLLSSAPWAAVDLMHACDSSLVAATTSDKSLTKALGWIPTALKPLKKGIWTACKPRFIALFSENPPKVQDFLLAKMEELVGQEDITSVFWITTLLASPNLFLSRRAIALWIEHLPDASKSLQLLDSFYKDSTKQVLCLQLFLGISSQLSFVERVRWFERIGRLAFPGAERAYFEGDSALYFSLAKEAVALVKENSAATASLLPHIWQLIRWLKQQGAYPLVQQLKSGAAAAQHRQIVLTVASQLDKWSQVVNKNPKYFPFLWNKALHLIDSHQIEPISKKWVDPLTAFFQNFPLQGDPKKSTKLSVPLIRQLLDNALAADWRLAVRYVCWLSGAGVLKTRLGMMQAWLAVSCELPKSENIGIDEEYVFAMTALLDSLLGDEKYKGLLLRNEELLAQLQTASRSSEAMRLLLHSKGIILFSAEEQEYFERKAAIALFHQGISQKNLLAVESAADQLSKLSYPADLLEPFVLSWFALAKEEACKRGACCWQAPLLFSQKMDFSLSSAIDPYYIEMLLCVGKKGVPANLKNFAPTLLQRILQGVDGEGLAACRPRGVAAVVGYLRTRISEGVQLSAAELKNFVDKLPFLLTQPFVIGDPLLALELLSVAEAIQLPYSLTDIERKQFRSSVLKEALSSANTWQQFLAVAERIIASNDSLTIEVLVGLLQEVPRCSPSEALMALLLHCLHTACISRGKLGKERGHFLEIFKKIVDFEAEIFFDKKFSEIVHFFIEDFYQLYLLMDKKEADAAMEALFMNFHKNALFLKSFVHPFLSHLGSVRLNKKEAEAQINIVAVILRWRAIFSEEDPIASALICYAERMMTRKEGLAVAYSTLLALEEVGYLTPGAAPWKLLLKAAHKQIGTSKQILHIAIVAAANTLCLDSEVWRAIFFACKEVKDEECLEAGWHGFNSLFIDQKHALQGTPHSLVDCWQVVFSLFPSIPVERHIEIFLALALDLPPCFFSLHKKKLVEEVRSLLLLFVTQLDVEKKSYYKDFVVKLAKHLVEKLDESSCVRPRDYEQLLEKMLACNSIDIFVSGCKILKKINSLLRERKELDKGKQWFDLVYQAITKKNCNFLECDKNPSHESLLNDAQISLVAGLYLPWTRSQFSLLLQAILRHPCRDVHFQVLSLLNNKINIKMQMDNIDLNSDCRDLKQLTVRCNGYLQEINIEIADFIANATIEILRPLAVDLWLLTTNLKSLMIENDSILTAFSIVEKPFNTPAPSSELQAEAFHCWVSSCKKYGVEQIHSCYSRCINGLFFWVGLHKNFLNDVVNQEERLFWQEVRHLVKIFLFEGEDKESSESALLIPIVNRIAALSRYKISEDKKPLWRRLFFECLLKLSQGPSLGQKIGDVVVTCIETFFFSDLSFANKDSLAYSLRELSKLVGKFMEKKVLSLPQQERLYAPFLQSPPARCSSDPRWMEVIEATVLGSLHLRCCLALEYAHKIVQTNFLDAMPSSSHNLWMVKIYKRLLQELLALKSVVKEDPVRSNTFKENEVCSEIIKFLSNNDTSFSPALFGEQLSASSFDSEPLEMISLGFTFIKIIALHESKYPKYLIEVCQKLYKFLLGCEGPAEAISDILSKIFDTLQVLVSFPVDSPRDSCLNLFLEQLFYSALFFSPSNELSVQQKNCRRTREIVEVAFKTKHLSFEEKESFSVATSFSSVNENVVGFGSGSKSVKFSMSSFEDIMRKLFTIESSGALEHAARLVHQNKLVYQNDLNGFFTVLKPLFQMACEKRIMQIDNTSTANWFCMLLTDCFYGEVIENKRIWLRQAVDCYVLFLSHLHQICCLERCADGYVVHPNWNEIVNALYVHMLGLIVLEGNGRLPIGRLSNPELLQKLLDLEIWSLQMMKTREIGKADKIKAEASLRYDEVMQLLNIAVHLQPDDFGRAAIFALMGVAKNSLH